MTTKVMGLLSELQDAVDAKDRGAFDDVLFDIYYEHGATPDDPCPPLPVDVAIRVKALNIALPDPTPLPLEA